MYNDAYPAVSRTVHDKRSTAAAVKRTVRYRARALLMLDDIATEAFRAQ